MHSLKPARNAFAKFQSDKKTTNTNLARSRRSRYLTVWPLMRYWIGPQNSVQRSQGISTSCQGKEKCNEAFPGSIRGCDNTNHKQTLPRLDNVAGVGVWGCCNRGHPPEIYIKIVFREISLANNLFFQLSNHLEILHNYYTNTWLK